MPSKRTGYAPWSLTREAGVQSATVEGTIEVPQSVQPTIDTGFVDEKGNWQGAKSSDEKFIAMGRDEAIADGATILAPSQTSSKWLLDMTGYSDLFIAIKPSRGGNYAITAVMAPDAYSFANLSPVNPATILRGNVFSLPNAYSMDPLFKDTAESLTTDVWNIFFIGKRLRGQKLLQFQITNNSGGESNIDTAFMRLV